MGRFGMALPVCSSKPNFTFKHSFLCTSTKKDPCTVVKFLLSSHHYMKPNQRHQTKIDQSHYSDLDQTSLCSFTHPFTSFLYNPCCSFVGVGYFCITLLVNDLSELRVSIRFVLIDASCHIWVCANDPACALQEIHRYLLRKMTAKFSRAVSVDVITLASCRPRRSSADLDSEIESVYLELRLTGEGDLARRIGLLLAFCFSLCSAHLAVCGQLIRGYCAFQS